MTWEELEIPGVFLVTPNVHHDSRGFFFESFKESALESQTAMSFEIAQMNTSFSIGNTVRGIHFTNSPIGQAKYVSCTQGEIIDVVLDIRVGSPTFGKHISVTLSEENQQSLFIPKDLGHAFWVTSDDARVTYLCSSEYDAKNDKSINPMDDSLALPWSGSPDLVVSEKDLAAPTLKDAQVRNILPVFPS